MISPLIPPSDLPTPSSPTSPGPASTLPRPARWTSRSKLLITALAVLCVPLISGAAWFFLLSGWNGHRPDLILHKVQRERLDLTIVERGTLESAYNNDVTCRVKSGQKGGGYATTIKWIIDDGSLVKEGDLLVKFDESALEDQKKTQKIALDQATAAWKVAQANEKIVLSQNGSDEKAARAAKELAKLDLQKYVDGDYPKLEKDTLSRKEIAESDLEMWRDRSAWSERMSKKGYLSLSQVQAERSRLRSAELTLQTIEKELGALKLGRIREETNLTNLREQAEDAHDRILIQNKAKLDQAMTDLHAKESVAKQEQARYKEINDELEKCEIRSPQDGMVVYHVSDSSRFSSSSRQSIVAQGEPVSEGQKLMRIPDLRHMQVVAKVHEALVSRVKVEQPAAIRVDAFPTRVIPGRVKLLATVASQADYFSSDVKVYQCTIAIDESVEGLKPGMSAEVTILVGGVLENVLTVPVHSIVGSAELGKERKVFVMTPTGPQERLVVIGMSNDKMAEVLSGLAEGEQVVLNPRAILGDSAKVREQGVDKVRVTFEGGEPPPKSKDPMGGNPESKAPPPAGKRPPATAKMPNPANKKNKPVSAE